MRQRSDSPDGAPLTKKRLEEPPAEPVHGQRPMLMAELNWRTKNHIQHCHGTFMLEKGCTGPILSEEFVKKEKIPLERRSSSVQMRDAQYDLMIGVGEYFTEALGMRQNVALVQRVLQQLRDAGLQAHVDKYSVHLKEVEYLGYNISEDGISISKEKAHAVQE
jgi:hypothetical protein